MRPDFALFLFSTDPGSIRDAVDAGVRGVVVDWERLGKEERQAWADTQIGRDTLEDLVRVRACTSAPVLCRIDGYGDATAEEVEEAIEAGADEILLPMVRTREEVEAVLELLGGRCGLGILVETVAATLEAEALGRLPLSRVYVGLNDLAIERGSPSIFDAVADGTVERLRRVFHVPFGFGGLTLPDRGHPIPCRLLIGEMARLGCDFSFLRRSFHRDVRGRDPRVEIPRLLEALRQALRRSPAAVSRDREELQSAIAGCPSRGTEGLRADASSERSVPSAERGGIHPDAVPWNEAKRGARTPSDDG